MTTGSAVIINKLGLHARPAALLARTAAGFASDIKIEKAGVEINAKSIMGIMLLAAEQGAVIKITASGPDEAEAVDALKKIISTNFEDTY